MHQKLIPGVYSERTKGYLNYPTPTPLNTGIFVPPVDEPIVDANINERLSIFVKEDGYYSIIGFGSFFLDHYQTCELSLYLYLGNGSQPIGDRGEVICPNFNFNGIPVRGTIKRNAFLRRGDTVHLRYGSIQVSGGGSGTNFYYAYPGDFLLLIKVPDVV